MWRCLHASGGLGLACIACYANQSDGAQAHLASGLTVGTAGTGGGGVMDEALNTAAVSNFSARFIATTCPQILHFTYTASIPGFGSAPANGEAGVGGAGKPRTTGCAGPAGVAGAAGGEVTEGVCCKPGGGGDATPKTTAPAGPKQSQSRQLAPLQKQLDQVGCFIQCGILI